MRVSTNDGLVLLNSLKTKTVFRTSDGRICTKIHNRSDAIQYFNLETGSAVCLNSTDRVEVLSGEMKVSPTRKFKDVEVGEAFEHQDTFWMKVGNSFIAAISVGGIQTVQGCLYHPGRCRSPVIDSHQNVLVVDIELVLSPRRVKK